MTNKGGRNSLIKVSRQNSKRPEPTADIWSLITRETICVTCESRSRREGEKLRSAGRHFPPVIWRGDRRRIRGEQLAFVLLNYRWHARALQVCGGSANGICMMPIMNNASIDLIIKEVVFQSENSYPCYNTKLIYLSIREGTSHMIMLDYTRVCTRYSQMSLIQVGPAANGKNSR